MLLYFFIGVYWPC